MKFLIYFIFIFSAMNLSAKSVVMHVCKSIAEGAKNMAVMKSEGVNENQIRKLIFEENILLKNEKPKVLSDEQIDSVLESKIEDLIFIFNKKNIELSPDQIYTVKFDKCFKELKSKGY